MIPPTFEYVAPKTLSEAVAALGGHENAKVLAGGQSLIPLMRFRLASPAVLVDINRVEGLSYTTLSLREIGTGSTGGRHRNRRRHRGASGRTRAVGDRLR